jgi:hypothetical protein
MLKSLPSFRPTVLSTARAAPMLAGPGAENSLMPPLKSLSDFAGWAARTTNCSITCALFWPLSEMYFSVLGRRDSMLAPSSVTRLTAPSMLPATMACTVSGWLVMGTSSTSSPASLK